MTNALVIGGDSTLAQALMPMLEKRDHHVIHTTRRLPAPPDSNIVFLDMLDPVLPLKVFRDRKVYILAAVTGFGRCEQDAFKSWRVKADAPAAIALQVAAKGG